MPNYCSNYAKFTHSDTKQIARVAEAFAKGALMQEFHPCPAVLEDPRGTSYGGPEKDEQDALRASNVEQHGYADWYDWRVANWGTKWDVGDNDADVGYTEGDTTVGFSFDSAWSPPIEFYSKMQELGFTVKAYYYEPGMAFCGRFDDGDDEEHDIKGNGDWVLENIPDDINEAMGIYDSMASWEEDEEG